LTQKEVILTHKLMGVWSIQYNLIFYREEMLQVFLRRKHWQEVLLHERSGANITYKKDGSLSILLWSLPESIDRKTSSRSLGVGMLTTEWRLNLSLTNWCTLYLD
jgi:hypothetical protein